MYTYSQMLSKTASNSGGLQPKASYDLLHSGLPLDKWFDHNFGSDLYFIYRVYLVLIIISTLYFTLEITFLNQNE